jgi:hypothetical protein
VAWENLRGWLGGGAGVRERELRETRDEWDQVQRLWRASPFSAHPSYEFANKIMTDSMEAAERCPAQSLLVALAFATDDVLSEEPIGDNERRIHIDPVNRAIGDTQVSDHMGHGTCLEGVHRRAKQNEIGHTAIVSTWL